MFCALNIVADHWSTESFQSYWRSSVSLSDCGFTVTGHSASSGHKPWFLTRSDQQVIYWHFWSLLTSSLIKMWLSWSHPEMERWKHDAAVTSAVLSHKHCVFVHHMCLGSLYQEHNCHPKSCNFISIQCQLLLPQNALKCLEEHSLFLSNPTTDNV